MGLEGGKIEWSQEAPTREKLWFLLVLVLVVYVFATLLWFPQRAKGRGIDKKIEKAQAQVDALEKVLAAQAVQQAAPAAAPAPGSTEADPRFAAYLDGKIRDREEVLGSVMQEVGSPKVLKNVTLLDMVFGDDDKQTDYVRVPFSLSLEGEFGETLAYLERIEKKPLLVIYDGIAMSALAENPLKLTTRLQASLFVVQSAEALKAP